MERNLSKAEWKILADVLLLAADSFSNHGSNDYEMDDTPENRDFVERVEYEIWRDYDNDGHYEIFVSDGKIVTGDSTIMRWFEEYARERSKTE